MRHARYTEILDSIAKTARACGRSPLDVKLVAVTKGRPWPEVVPIYEAGQRDFGESRVVEAFDKMGSAPEDCRWHLIGPLQKNKVRKAVGKFVLIHSVDTVELARKISDISIEMGVTSSVLLQANVSGEASKQGLSAEGWKMAFNEVIEMPGIMVKGLMTMAPVTEEQSVIRGCFRKLRILRDELREAYNDEGLTELSMGMSGDFRIAIEEGATILRIGSALFE